MRGSDPKMCTWGFALQNFARGGDAGNPPLKSKGGTLTIFRKKLKFFDFEFLVPKCSLGGGICKSINFSCIRPSVAMVTGGNPPLKNSVF